MILQGQEHTLQRSGLMGERSYGIALTPKMYSMMSDKLYTDRIGSVVREVCSNAWDAQKMRAIAEGQPQVPFKVALPTDLEPHFIVEDTGPGMPDERAQELYSTLGLSTKELTNDQIGAFGLGSKSPFAVADTFTVENTYDGVTHFYLCFKAENGLPSLLKTGERNEGRANGVKVIIPAPGSKYLEYKEALKRQLIVMDPKPIINNIESFNFPEPKIYLRNEVGWLLTNAGDFNLKSQGVYVRMGMVLYPVDTYQIEKSSGFHKNLGPYTALVLEVPIGAVEPLPSREGLTYDKRTIDNIKIRYHEFEKDYRKRLKAEVEGCESPLAAWRKILELYQASGINMMYDNLYVLGTQINDNPIENVFPYFDHQTKEEYYDYKRVPVDPSDLDYDPDDTRTHIKEIPEKKSRDITLRLARFVGDTYTRGDLRLNAKHAIRDFRTLRFNELDKIDKGNIRFLLIDEAEPKHRIARLKSWLNEITYSQTFYLVRVNGLYPGDHLDFSEFIASLEMMERGITKKEGVITRLSSILPPKKEKVERDPDDDKEVVGLSWVKAGGYSERYFKWSKLEELMEGTEDDDGNVIPSEFAGKVFYVEAKHDEIEKYKGLNATDFKTLASEIDVTVIIARKTNAAKNLARLQKLGVPEFKEFINKYMANYQPSDDDKKIGSAKMLADANADWFGYSKWLNIRDLLDALKQSGVWVHPFFDTVSEIKRISSNYVTHLVTKEDQMLNFLKRRSMLHFFKQDSWLVDSEIDLSTEFQAKEEAFNTFYPAFHVMFGYGASLSDRVQYIRDYNTLRGMNPLTIDYTEVLESSII